jgi:hypothetical protein
MVEEVRGRVGDDEQGEVLGAAAGRRAAEHAHPPHGVAGVSQASANSSLRAPV